MQGEKKGGAGGKGVWGKIGDEYTKTIPQYYHDEEEIEAAAQEKFIQQVKEKLISDKLEADELEPFIRKDLLYYPPMKSLFVLHNPTLIEYLKEKEEINIKCRPYIEEALQESNVILTIETSQKLCEYFNSLSPQGKTIVAKRMIQISLEKEESARDNCLHYFKDFYMLDIISKEQIRRGFDLIYINMDDILIDIPFAIGYIFRMVEKLVFKIKLFKESFLYRIPDTLLNTTTYTLYRL